MCLILDALDTTLLQLLPELLGQALCEAGQDPRLDLCPLRRVPLAHTDLLSLHYRCH